MSQRVLVTLLVIVSSVAVALAIALGVVLTNDDEDAPDVSQRDARSEAGAEACEIYSAALADSPEAITSIDALPQIREMLQELDDPTRAAFAALITAADSNSFVTGATESRASAAAEVRTVCLSEHGVTIAN